MVRAPPPVVSRLYSVCVALKKKSSNINKIKKETAHFRFHLFNWGWCFYSPFPFPLNRPVFIMKEWKCLSASEVVWRCFEAYLKKKKKKAENIIDVSAQQLSPCENIVACRGCTNYCYIYSAIYFLKVNSGSNVIRSAMWKQWLAVGNQETMIGWLCSFPSWARAYKCLKCLEMKSLFFFAGVSVASICF